MTPQSYQNPILPMDYSDPDAIRVGDDYYLVASSFTYLPGVPVLHSKDLVHWQRIGYCVQELPFERYTLPAHGCGTWAPALRYHNEKFWAFIPLPDEGIFVTSAVNPAGPWEPLRCIKSAKGWIDPCPFWDDDGNVYMAYAFANSRCGIKHKLAMAKLDTQTLEVIEDGPIIFEGLQKQHTIEGPKLYKRNGWYYIFAPAGGVENGWQVVLRSRNIYGPYEDKIVLHRGNTKINGPHQGAWVDTPQGQDWFLHFQDKDTSGRVIHLQPMCWRADWPFMGQDQNADEIGEPVTQWLAPAGENITKETPLLAQEGALALQWQWQANPKAEWYRALEKDALQLNCCTPIAQSLWQMPNVLSQMMPDANFKFSVTLSCNDLQNHTAAGICMLGLTYSALQLCVNADGITAQVTQGQTQSNKPTATAEETMQTSTNLALADVQNGVELSLQVCDGKTVQYFVNHNMVGTPQPVVKCVWTGARLGLFARGETGAWLFEKAKLTNSAGCLKENHEMAKLKIRLDGIHEAKAFHAIAAQMDFDVDLCSGRYCVDAKSLLGIFSLDLCKGVEVVIPDENYEQAQKSFAPFIEY